VISTRDVRLIVDGNEIGIGVAKCVGRACNRACWTVYALSTVVYALSTVVYALSTVVHALSTVVYALSTVVYALSTVVYALR